MEQGSKRKSVGQWVAVLLAGMVAGTVMLTPVGAHITTFNHLKTKHFYTKKAADSRFVNVGEKASDADKLDGKESTEFLGATAKATDADKLDGVDSTGLLRDTITVLTEGSAAPGSNQQTDALCPAGYQALGGGYNFVSSDPGAGVRVTWNEPLIDGDNLTAANAGQNPAANGWRIRVVNTTAITFTYTVGVICSL